MTSSLYGNKILFIGAHSDDIEIGCGGIAAKLSEEYHLIAFATATDCGKDRKNESRKSAEILGLSEKDGTLFFGKLGDGTLESNRQELRSWLKKIKTDFNPTAVFFHFGKDTHSDHSSLSDACRAVFADNILLEYYIPKQGPLDVNFIANHHVEISPYIEKKVSLIKCFESQSDKAVYVKNSKERAALLYAKWNNNNANGFSEEFLIVSHTETKTDYVRSVATTPKDKSKINKQTISKKKYLITIFFLIATIIVLGTIWQILPKEHELFSRLLLSWDECYYYDNFEALDVHFIPKIFSYNYNLLNSIRDSLNKAKYSEGEIRANELKIAYVKLGQLMNCLNINHRIAVDKSYPEEAIYSMIELEDFLKENKLYGSIKCGGDNWFSTINLDKIELPLKFKPSFLMGLPLSLYVNNIDFENVKKLLRNGVDPSKTFKGMTALQLAENKASNLEGADQIKMNNIINALRIAEKIWYEYPTNHIERNEKLERSFGYE